MIRSAVVLLMVGLLVTGICLVSILGSAQESPPQPDPSTEVALPGEQLSGTLGVHGTELEGEVSQRTFGIKIARAATNESRATVVRETLDAQETRLRALHARQRALEQAWENDSISPGVYRAQVAMTAAQIMAVKRHLNATETATDGLPNELLERNGITLMAIHSLQTNASEMTGPEVAAIATSIAGPGIGNDIAEHRAPVSNGPPATAGPPRIETPTDQDLTTVTPVNISRTDIESST